MLFKLINHAILECKHDELAYKSKHIVLHEIIFPQDLIEIRGVSNDPRKLDPAKILSLGEFQPSFSTGAEFEIAGEK